MRGGVRSGSQLFDDTLNWDSSLFHWLSDASI